MIRFNENFPNPPEEEAGDITQKLEAQMRADLEGKLDPEEIERYIGYETKGLSEGMTLDDQIDYLYLDLKRYAPTPAALMLSEIDPLHEAGIESEEDILRLCEIIARYRSEAKITYGQWRYDIYLGAIHKHPIE